MILKIFAQSPLFEVTLVLSFAAEVSCNLSYWVPKNPIPCAKTMKDHHNLRKSLERPIFCDIEPLDGRLLSIPVCILKGTVGCDGRHCARVEV